MHVTFLGTAGSFPTAERSAPSIALKRRGEALLFDCGEGTQRQMVRARMGFRPQTKIFITHMHGDHILGLPGLLQTMSLFDVKSELEIFGPKGIRDFVTTIMETVKFRLSFPLRIVEVDEGVVYRTKEYAIRAVWAEHSVPNLAYALIENVRPGKFRPDRARTLGIKEGPLWSRLQRGEAVQLPTGDKVCPHQVLGAPRRGRKVVYSGDTRPCEAVEKLTEKADLLIHEASLGERSASTTKDHWHSTVGEAAELAARAQVSRLILTHISGRCRNPDVLLREARAFFPRVLVAQDLLKVFVPLSDEKA
jgi:ribonuclease Z